MVFLFSVNPNIEPNRLTLLSTSHAVELIVGTHFCGASQAIAHRKKCTDAGDIP